MTVNRLTSGERREALELAYRLMDAFRWDHTPQGAAYWHEVNDALMEVATVAPSPESQSARGSADENRGAPGPADVAGTSAPLRADNPISAAVRFWTGGQPDEWEKGR